MRFEKLNEDKIRITLSREDLSKKQIDFHSFMANSIESQDLFFDMLDKAEKEIGFITKNYQIRIEAFAISSGDFVVTVTRSLPIEGDENGKVSKENTRFSSKGSLIDDLSSLPNSLKNSVLSPSKPRRKLRIKRKDTSLTSTNALYRFACFEDFTLFSSFLKQHGLEKEKFAKKILLYQYKDTYYLSFENILLECSSLKKLFSSITEFATFMSHSDLFQNKLYECGKVIMKHNAIRTCLKFFV